MSHFCRQRLRSLALAVFLGFAALASWATGPAQATPIAATSLVPSATTPGMKDVIPAYYYYYRPHYYHRYYYHRYYYHPHYYHHYHYYRPYYHRHYYYRRHYWHRHYYHRHYW